jgi:eukaryotic-like serine/threonine-protein kinase
LSPIDALLSGSCLSTEQIREILLGNGPDEAADALAQHLIGCAQCERAVDAISLDAHVLDALQIDSQGPAPSAEEFADVASRVSRLSQLSVVFDQPNPLSVAQNQPPCLPLPELPAMLGPYRLVQLLGAGGMGVVYRAEDTSLRRFVALKLLQPGIDREARYRDRFLREARAMAALKHDNIVVIHQVGEAAVAGQHGTVPFLAMELLEGENLQAWMAAIFRPVAAWVARIGRQAAAGLVAAHAQGLIHRDIKPANLWLEAPAPWLAEPAKQRLPLGAVARLKVLDFGLARPSDDGSGSHAVSGTPGYMAPEQSRGEQQDGRSDLFGLGCVLFELSTGAHPFPKRERDHISEFLTPLPIREANPAIPAPLATLIEQMLARDPVDRPASAREVEQRLSAIEADMGRDGAPATAHRRIRRGVLAASLLVVALATAILARTWQRSAPIESANAAPIASPAPPEDEPDDPNFPNGPPDAHWARQLAKRPPKEQFGLVARKLAELNPGYDWRPTTGWVEPELVIRFTVNSNHVHDIRPLRALVDLHNVAIKGLAPEGGEFTDVSPISGLPLYALTINEQPRFRDLSPLKGCQLKVLNLSGTGVDSLNDLAALPLQELIISETRVMDLAPIRSLKNLHKLHCDGCPIESLEPLAGTQIHELKADLRSAKDLDILGKMPKLERINGKSLNDFRRAFKPTQN